MEILKSLARDGEMLVAVYLSILMDIPSGPLALVASIVLEYTTEPPQWYIGGLQDR